MAYGVDFAGAARRHLAAGQCLAGDDHEPKPPGHKAVAGYLFGIAGELALKEIMRESGMRPLSSEQRRDDPFYAHFPQLARMVERSAHGRRQGDLLRIVKGSSCFGGWSTDMRYAPTRDISEGQCTRWRTEARTMIGKMGL